VRPLLKRNARKDIQLPVATGCAGLQRYLSLAQAVDMISIINEHQQQESKRVDGRPASRALAYAPRIRSASTPADLALRRHSAAAPVASETQIPPSKRADPA